MDTPSSSIRDLARRLLAASQTANQPLLDLWERKLEEIVGKDFLELGYPPELAASNGRKNRRFSRQMRFHRRKSARFGSLILTGA